MRRNALIVVLALAAAGAASAQKGKVPPLPQPPPYGAYFLDNLRQSRDEYYAAQDAIAKHYGYKNESDAYRACLRSKATPNCAKDIVAHRRHESPEIAKYGFKTWEDAVEACVRQRSKVGPYFHCSADPFLAMRVKQ